MKSTEATPRPWHAEDTTQPVVEITSGDKFICRAHRKHAPLIVRAVNAHDTLVAALEKAEELYQVGIINDPDGLYDEVVSLRHAALLLAKHGAAASTNEEAA